MGEKQREVPDEVNIGRNINERNIPDESKVPKEEMRTELEKEEELSLETIEKMIEAAMEKVQDINEYGTAYHVITESKDIPSLLEGPEGPDKRPWKERLEDVLKHGLLGTARPARMGTAHKVSPAEWVKNARKEKRGEVMFNIVGREFSSFDVTEQEHKEQRKMGKTWIELGAYMWQDFDKTAIIFDLSQFEEVEPRKDYDLGLPKPKSFHIDSLKTKTNDRGEAMADREFGFSLYPRVSPNTFKGIVFKATRKHPKIENAEIEEGDPSVLDKRAEEIVALMKELYRDKPHLMVPVYDVHGNLYWPKKLSHSQIKESGEKSDELNQESREEKRYSSTVLEIGCGPIAAPWLREDNFDQYSNAHIFLTDVEEKTLKRAEKIIERKVNEMGDNFTGKVECATVDAKNLPFENNTADEIYIANVFGQPGVTEKQKITSESVRILANNGELIIVEWATPDIALSISRSKMNDEKAWKDALDSFTSQFEKLGLKVKTIESLKYEPDLSTTGIIDPDKIIEIFRRQKERLEQLPYAKKFIGGLLFPKASDDRPFIVVFQKINPEK